MKLQMFTGDRLGVAPTFDDRVHSSFRRESLPTGGPWVDHENGEITLWLYGTDHRVQTARHTLEETIDLTFSDDEWDKIIVSVQAAREGRFLEHMQDQAQALKEKTS